MTGLLTDNGQLLHYQLSFCDFREYRKFSGDKKMSEETKGAAKIQTIGELKIPAYLFGIVEK